MKGSLWRCRILVWVVILGMLAGIVALAPEAFATTAEVVGLTPSPR